MSKRYKTKNQLIYTPIGILGKLRVLWEWHLKEYGLPPERIYLPKKEFKEFKKIACFYSQFLGHYVFRGREVLEL